MRWPGRDEVHAAAQQWARRLAEQVSGVIAVGYFGSYARGDAGVGSDLDLVIVVEDGVADALHGPWAVEKLPVPAEKVLLPRSRWQQIAAENTRFYRTLRDEAVWLVGGPPASTGDERGVL